MKDENLNKLIEFLEVLLKYSPEMIKQYDRLSSAIFNQKVQDIISMDLIDLFQKRGRLESIDLKKLKEILDESINFWLKEELHDLVCQLKHNSIIADQQIYKTIFFIRLDLEDQKQFDSMLEGNNEPEKAKKRVLRVLAKGLNNNI